MASIGSLTGGSSSSSIYGSRNVLSGLASGLDTESMIENAVSGYQLKITNLQQDRTKLEWQQEAYRSIITKMVNFSQKYTSYTSGTNLLSKSFFDSAINMVANGENAGKVSASGTTTSNAQINSVSQIATAARYAVGSGNLKASNEAAGSFDIGGTVKVGTLKGTMTLGYGGKTLSLRFDEGDVFTSAQEMADAINEQLGEQTITFDSGTQAKASERVKAVVDGDSIRFETVKSNDGNGVWIDSASGSVKSALSLDPSSDDTTKSFTFNAGSVAKEQSMVDYISEKGFSIVLDGVSKTIQGPTKEELGGAAWDAMTTADKEAAYINALNEKIAHAFGSNKLTVSDVNSGDGITLRFDAANADATFQVNSAADKAMNMEGGLTSYVNTSRTIGDLLGEEADWDSWRVAADGEAKKATDGDYYVDAKGNRVAQADDGKWYRVNEGGETLYGFNVNGETVATFTKDSTLQDVLDGVNKNENSGITAAYSRFTGKFTFTANDTGANSKISFGGDGLSAALFGGSNTVSESAKALSLLEGYDSLAGEEFSMNVEGLGEVSFTFKGDTGSMRDVLGRINEQLAGTDYQASYSETDGSVVVKNKTTGETADVTYNEGVARDLFDAVASKNGYTNGRDAKFSVTVNGETRELTRTTNTIDIDGMSITLKDTFEEGEAVTFTNETDTDKIVSAVKSLVEDYNAMATEIKNAYSTLPLQTSSGKSYEPLTDEDRADMSESAVKSYEEKAKTGLLFGDRDLSSLYQGMTNALNVLGVSGTEAEKLGLTTSYSNGTTTLALNESKLVAALESDPDSVKEIFTRSKANGDSSDGLMQGLKTQLDKYASTTGASKGILIQKAGSTLAPTSIYQNTLQSKLDDLDELIEKWQDKLTDKIDYYNSKFTALEQLINEMNSQSSALAGLTGGY